MKKLFLPVACCLLVVSAAELLSTPFCSAQLPPVHDHVVILMLENKGYSDIIGSSSAPYINNLATDSMGALFTQSFGQTHPSQPNYIDLFSGDNQNVITDNTPFSFSLPFSTPNLCSELIGKGKTFIGYSEDLPSVGFTGDSVHPWVRKHCPWINWQGTGTNGIAANLNQPFTSFPSDYDSLPTVCFVVPNLDNDMHNGTIDTSDKWVQNNLDSYIQWAKTHNSLLILTFDEDDYLQFNNQITTIFVGQNVKAGQYSETVNHYRVLRTIEDMYGLAHLDNSTTETPIIDCWIDTVTWENQLQDTRYGLQVYPNPTSGKIQLAMGSANAGVKGEIEIFNVLGQEIYKSSIRNLPTSGTGQAQSAIDISAQPDGIYSVRLKYGEKIFTGTIVKM